MASLLSYRYMYGKFENKMVFFFWHLHSTCLLWYSQNFCTECPWSFVSASIYGQPFIKVLWTQPLYSDTFLFRGKCMPNSELLASVCQCKNWASGAGIPRSFASVTIKQIRKWLNTELRWNYCGLQMQEDKMFIKNYQCSFPSYCMNTFETEKSEAYEHWHTLLQHAINGALNCSVYYVMILIGYY